MYPHPTNCLEEESFQQTQPLPSPFVGSRPLQVLHEKVFFFGDFLTKRYSFDYDIRFPRQKGTIWLGNTDFVAKSYTFWRGNMNFVAKSKT